MNKGRVFFLLTLIFLLFSIGINSIYYNKKINQIEIKYPIPVELITDYGIPLNLKSNKLKNTNDKKELLKLMKKCNNEKNKILKLMPEKNSVNYKSHKKIIIKEVQNLNHNYTIYKEKYNNIIKAEEEQRKRIEAERKRQEQLKREEQKIQIAQGNYSVATTIWRYLRNLGYNPYVCAGIIGNMMTEAGGQTLNIRPIIYSPSRTYYGICQWSVRFYPQVNGASLQGQLNFLAKTISYEFNTYGSLYYRGFNYNSFLALKDARSAAVAFAKVYERCGSGSYSIRQSNAIKAYNYFMN